MPFNYIKYITSLCLLTFSAFLSASSSIEAQQEKLSQEVLKLIHSGYLDRAEEKNNHLKSLSSDKDSFYHKRSILSSALIAHSRGDNEGTVRYLNLIDEHNESLIIQYFYYDIMFRYAFQIGQSQLGINYLTKTIEIGEQLPNDRKIKIDVIFNKLYLIYYTENIEFKLSSKQKLPEVIDEYLQELKAYEKFMTPYEKYEYYIYSTFYITIEDNQDLFYNLSYKLINLGKQYDFPSACIYGNLYLATYYKAKNNSKKELNHLLLANNQTKKIQFLYFILLTRYRLMDYYDHQQNYPMAKYWAIKALFPPGTDYSNHFDIYGRLSNIYEKTGQIDSAFYYKKIDYDKYKGISRTHDNNMESLLIKNMEENIEHKEYIIRRNYWFIGLTLVGLLLVGILLYKNRIINNKLTSQNNELEESYTTLENFSHILSHDLKAPIRSIDHLATFIEEDEQHLSEEGKENLNLIKQSTNNAFILITNIMTYIHSKDNEIKKEHHLFKNLIQKAQDNLTQLISSNQALILYESLPKTIYGNNILLIQLFQNLIQNSIKYKQKDISPIITISFRKEKKYGIISIQDNGIGIKKDKQSTIFKAFTQEQFVSPEQGIGLGLSICKNIMNHHKGKIEALSEKNSGTTINLYFPVSSF
ncbi:phytochrome-like protein cph1 [Flavobacteriaceae bacterium UJ101]|nr:phytochrome-like protein cph1 [Flavobacteriaceae bacterium UJ101]